MKLLATFPSKQNGATLLVALILLLIMSIVGIGATQLSKLQYQMARNTQFELDMYQVTQSESNTQVDNINADGSEVFPLDYSNKDYVFTDAELMTDNDNLSAAAKITFIDSNKAPFGAHSFRNFSSSRYELDTAVKINAAAIGSKQKLGLQILSPKQKGRL